MIGYHYTSQENWEKIKNEGLTPYLITNMEIYHGLHSMLHEQFDKIFGIWVWEREQDPLSHMGNVIRAAVVHGATRTVLLKVKFPDSAILRVKGRRIHMVHEGSIEKLVYHKDEGAYILSEPVPSDKIEMMQSFDLVELLRRSGGMEYTFALRADAQA